MKKIVILLIAIMFLSSCARGPKFSRLFDNDEKIANARMDKLLIAIENKDKNTLKKMFSENAINATENFDQSIDELFAFYEGNSISYNNWSALNVEETFDYGDKQKIFDSTYDVETNQQKYRFAIQDFIIDTIDPKNVGIWSLYIIKMEDDTDQNFAYRGDGENTPGINFNKISVLPEIYE